MDKFGVVKKYVDKIDIENLLALGAPGDEYDKESLKISQLINGESSTEEISKAITSVFCNSIGSDLETEKNRREDIVRIATLIREELNKN